MNADDLPTPLHYTELPTATDQLARLVNVQRDVIQKLRDEIKRLKQANATLGGELLDASEKRSEVLATLEVAVQNGRDLCHHLVHQRDVILGALRALVEHLKNQPITQITYWGGEAFAKSAREAFELVKLIDQRIEAQRRQDAKNG